MPGDDLGRPPPEVSGGPTPEAADTDTTTSTPAPIRTSSRTHSSGSARRYAASRRMPPLAPCGCRRDPEYDRHRCDGEISDHVAQAGAQAARHLIGVGFTPIVGIETLRALHRRGGHDRKLAQELYDLAGG
jgi:hypothetical protein